MASVRDKRRELRELEKRLAQNSENLGELIAKKEHVEQRIASSRTKREERIEAGYSGERITARIQELIEERQALRARLKRARRKRERFLRAAKRLRRRIRNMISPKVIDLGFDRTAVRPLVRQGTIYGSVGHYTAGPLDDDGDDESIALWRAYDRAHKAQGWSCLGYNIGVTRDGTVVRLRGPEYVGAHTLNYNTGRVGISVHGTTGHTWTRLQRRGLRKALRKWNLKNKPVIGHKQAPGQATACPGNFLAGYNKKGRR